MRKLMLFFFLILSVAARNSYGQGFANPPMLRIGDLATDQVTYNQVLKYPKIVYNMQGCEVANFDITISDRGNELYGPYKIKGSELTHLSDLLCKISREPVLPSM